MYCLLTALFPGNQSFLCQLPRQKNILWHPVISGMLANMVYYLPFAIIPTLIDLLLTAPTTRTRVRSSRKKYNWSPLYNNSSNIFMTCLYTNWKFVCRYFCIFICISCQVNWISIKYWVLWANGPDKRKINYHI